jgi:hypothetical protein
MLFINHLPIQWVIVTVCPVEKLQGREADLSAVLSAEVPLSHTTSWRYTQLINGRDSFTAIYSFVSS